MNYKNTVNKYTTASHHTTKIRQIIMLYEGVIKFIANTKFAIQNNDIQTRFNMIERSLKIITALRAALDFTVGGNIPYILAEYYDVIDKKLMQIHMSHNPKTCDEVINVLSAMKNTWIEIEEGDNLPIMLETNFENLHLSI